MSDEESFSDESVSDDDDARDNGSDDVDGESGSEDVVGEEQEDELEG